MKTILKKLVFGCILACTTGSITAQDIHFSQYQETPLDISPALAGLSKGYLRVTGNYRSQWAAFGNPYQTMTLNADAPVFGNIRKNRSYIGAGLNVFRDKSGSSALSKLQIAGDVSGILVMGQSRLSLGVEVGWAQRSIQTGGLTWDSQYINGAYNAAGPAEGGGASTSFWDYSTGMAYYYEKAATNMTSNDHFDLLVTAGVFHLLRPNQGLFGGDPLKMRYCASLQARIGIKSTNLSLLPKFVYQQQASLTEMNLGCIFQYMLKVGSNVTGFNTQSGLGFGASYRVGDAIIPEFLYYYGNWSLGVSYDINVSSLTPYSYGRGGLEVSLRYVDVGGVLFGKSASSKTLF